MSELNKFLSGEALVGDDFTPEQIREWYLDEKEGYAGLLSAKGDRYKYPYHALNKYHGYRFLESRNRFQNVLGLGSAFGDEFLPILSKIDRLTIIDPSDRFGRDEVHGIPCRYVKPAMDGKMPFEDGSFDLITCLGVLHHIANVSDVVAEIFRCLSPGGFALLHEPIVSMGDWSRPRRGLTKRERGIPPDIFLGIVSQAGFQIVAKSLCVFSLSSSFCNVFGIRGYNNPCFTWLDAILSSLFRWNIRYHSDKIVHRFRPIHMYLVLTKN